NRPRSGWGSSSSYSLTSMSGISPPLSSREHAGSRRHGSGYEADAGSGAFRDHGAVAPGLTTGPLEVSLAQASTARGSKALPAAFSIQRRASSWLQADRYARSEVRASYTSATARIRASRGISSPFNRSG